MIASIEGAESVLTSTLVAYHLNARKGDLEAIKKSLEANGQFRALVVNRGSLTGRPNEVLAGNHTLAAMLALNLRTTAVTWVDVDDATAVRIVAADNRTHDTGRYDNEALERLLRETPDLEGTGYDDEFLARLILDNHPKAPSPAEMAGLGGDLDLQTQPGDLWALGDHRMLCADPTDIYANRRVLGPEETAHVMWVSPRTEVDAPDQDLTDLLVGALDALRSPGVAYIEHTVSPEAISAAMRDAGYTSRQTLVWLGKGARGDYQSEHQLVTYATTTSVGRKSTRWYGGGQPTSVFRQDPAATPYHRGIPPTAIAAMTRNSAPEGRGILFSPTGGTGAPLIAAEGAGLRGRIIEANPIAVDHARLRWERLTGQTAHREAAE